MERSVQMVKRSTLEKYFTERFPIWNQEQKHNGNVKKILELAPLIANNQATKEQVQLFKLLLEAEYQREKALEAVSKANGIQKKASKKADKERNHKLYNAAGLLILAGLIDSKTGDLKYDTETVLGYFAQIQQWIEQGLNSNDPQEQARLQRYKARGHEILQRTSQN